MYEQQTSREEQALADAYNALRFEFMRGIQENIYAPIPTPGFAPRSMPAITVVAQLLRDDETQVMLAQVMRVVVRAAEGMDPVIAAMAQALIARMARKHALLHGDEALGS